MARLVGSASDVALVLDNKGTVKDIAHGSDQPIEESRQWVGRPWIETVTVESRSKVEDLLSAANDDTARPRHVNHPSSSGPDVPILYRTVQIGKDGPIVAFGRDLREMAALQQRLVEAQLSMEREYDQLRHAETRYRLLFQLSTEAVIIVDASTNKIVEANGVAETLLGQDTGTIIGESFPLGTNSKDTEAVLRLMADARAAERAGEVRVSLMDEQGDVSVSASQFRHDSKTYLLMRLTPLRANGTVVSEDKTRSDLLALIDKASDGFVVTSPDGNVLTANQAFLDLAELPTEERAKGNSLDRWLGRSGVDLSVLLSNIRKSGAVRLFATKLRGENGSVADVEISAVMVSSGEHACYGFVVRDVSQRLPSGNGGENGLPKSVEQLTDLVGRVSMKDIVRQTTDVIERLCIEAALELTDDNRASAAEMLGLSRQSLYVKLRRHGIDDEAIG